MNRLSRVTSAALDVLEGLARLEGAGWLDGYWEDQNPREGLPRRRFHRLQPDGLLVRFLLNVVRRNGVASRLGWRRHRPRRTSNGEAAA